MGKIPIVLLLTYALFRMAEYFALKNYQALASDGFARRNSPVLAMFGVVLLPARIIGWVFLVWLALKVGVIATLGMVIVAFIVSLILQSTIGIWLIRVLGPLAGVTYLVSVPILAVVIGIMIASI